MLFDIVRCLAFVSSSPPGFLKAWKGKLLTTLYVANNSFPPKTNKHPKLGPATIFFKRMSLSFSRIIVRHHKHDWTWTFLAFCATKLDWKQIIGNCLLWLLTIWTRSPISRLGIMKSKKDATSVSFKLQNLLAISLFCSVVPLRMRNFCSLLLHDSSSWTSELAFRNCVG